MSPRQRSNEISKASTRLQVRSTASNSVKTWSLGCGAWLRFFLVAALGSLVLLAAAARGLLLLVASADLFAMRFALQKQKHSKCCISTFLNLTGCPASQIPFCKGVCSRGLPSVYGCDLCASKPTEDEAADTFRALPSPAPRHLHLNTLTAQTPLALPKTL